MDLIFDSIGNFTLALTQFPYLFSQLGYLLTLLVDCLLVELFKFLDFFILLIYLYLQDLVLLSSHSKGFTLLNWCAIRRLLLEHLVLRLKEVNTGLKHDLCLFISLTKLLFHVVGIELNWWRQIVRWERCSGRLADVFNLKLQLLDEDTQLPDLVIILIRVDLLLFK